MKKIILLLFIPLATLAQEIKTTEIKINSLINGTLFSSEQINTQNNLVILISGSGMTDRNGNFTGGQNNSLLFLAEAIAKERNSVFSFDKRIFAQLKAGNFDEKSLLFEDMITDVKDIITYFKLQKKYAKIIVAGHSEGSLIGMIAAKNNADAFISIAGPGRTADELIIEQIEKQAPMLLSEVQANFTKLKKGEAIELKNQMLASLFRESIQPYMLSWIKYNPQEEIKKLTIPTLIINGTTDIQTSVKEAEILKKANPKATLTIIEGMNHVFKQAPNDMSENKATYNNPSLPIVPELAGTINNFIKSL